VEVGGASLPHISLHGLVRARKASSASPAACPPIAKTSAASASSATKTAGPPPSMSRRALAYCPATAAPRCLHRPFHRDLRTALIQPPYPLGRRNGNRARSVRSDCGRARRWRVRAPIANRPTRRPVRAPPRPRILGRARRRGRPSSGRAPQAPDRGADRRQCPERIRPPSAKARC
jgi:hypothetical protein